MIFLSILKNQENVIFMLSVERVYLENLKDVLKTSKISSECHIKACRSLKLIVISKIPCNAMSLEQHMVFLLALK